MRGKGSKPGIQYHYVNECAAVVNWACKADTTLINAKAKAIFDQGAEPVREKYAVGAHYEIPFERQGDSLVLPMMSGRASIEGWINDEPVFEKLDADDQILEAGDGIPIH